jgi:hypothetical protein
MDGDSNFRRVNIPKNTKGNFVPSTPDADGMSTGNFFAKGAIDYDDNIGPDCESRQSWKNNIDDLNSNRKSEVVKNF